MEDVTEVPDSAAAEGTESAVNLDSAYKRMAWSPDELDFG
jgi:hypothetical protein